MVSFGAPCAAACLPADPTRRDFPLADKAENPIRGTTPIEIGGVTYVMRLNWHGIAQIREMWPDGYDLMDVKTLATIISLALPNH
jgi:hypothetical protein